MKEMSKNTMCRMFPPFSKGGHPMRARKIHFFSLTHILLQ